MVYIFIVLGFLPLIAGHGFLKGPPSRNFIANSNGCPACLNAGGVSVMYKTYDSKARYGVCGDAYNKPRDHEAGGKFAKNTRPVRTYKSGGIIPIHITFTQNHKGRMSFSLCALSNGTLSSKDEKSLTTQHCFDKHTLERADGKGEYSFLLGTEKTFQAEYRLPRGLKCDHCVLQWHWVTGNSCRPAHTLQKYCNPGVGPCFKDGAVPEEWFNCADVRIT
jgi:hypothetical protein